MKKIIRQLMILAMAFVMFQCVGTEVQAATTYRTKTMKITYQTNKKVRIKPTNYSGSISWKTSNSDIFTIDSQGNGIVKGIGKVTVTGTASYQGKSIVQKYKLTIVRPILKTMKIKFAERYRNGLGGGSSTVFYSYSWTQDKYADGYELQLSASSNFSKGKTDTFRNTKKDIKKYETLKNGELGNWILICDEWDEQYNTLYLRIRSYIKIGDKKYYSKWSAVKSVKKRYGSSKMEKYVSMHPD